jgi:hypothetical protein
LGLHCRDVLHFVTFHAEGIVFVGYSYPGASVARAGFVRWSSVRDADPDAAPPELRLHTGETLAVPAPLREQLRSALSEAGVPTVRRADLWALLLEPFLDTELDENHQRATISRLIAFGVSQAETEEIRGKVGDRMLKYNALHWDWVHLGLFDMLDAHLPPALLRWLPSRSRKFQDLYWWAMSLAERAAILR